MKIKEIQFKEQDVLYLVEMFAVPFSGKIVKNEIEYLQQFFKEPLTEEMVRQAIDENNWGGDYTENFHFYGFKGDSDNRDSITTMIRKTFNLK